MGRGSNRKSALLEALRMTDPKVFGGQRNDADGSVYSSNRAIAALRTRLQQYTG
jgi:hypothetical protein